MFKMGLHNTDYCSQCTLGSTDDYLHAIWHCQPVHSFWITVTETLSTIMSHRIPSSHHTLSQSTGDLSGIHIPQKYRNLLLIAVAKKSSSSKLEIKEILPHPSLDKFNFRIHFNGEAQCTQNEANISL